MKTNDEFSLLFNGIPDLLTVADIQKTLNISRNMAYKLVNEGFIRHMRIGKVIKIPKPCLIEYVSKCCSDGLAIDNQFCQL